MKPEEIDKIFDKIKDSDEGALSLSREIFEISSEILEVEKMRNISGKKLIL